MQVTGRKLGWTVSIILSGLFVIVWLRNARQERREARADFEWFSRLGFPEVQGRPYVRVATGRWSQRGAEQPRQNQYVYGFLLETNRDRFSVFTLDLSTRTMTNTAAGTPEYSRVGYELLYLRHEADARLRELRKPPAKEDFWLHFGERLPEQAQTFVLGWVCWRHGLDAAALSLYEEAWKLPLKKPNPQTARTIRERFRIAFERLEERWRKLTKNNSQAPATLRQEIEKQVAHALMWQAVAAFADPSITRPQLLSQFEAIARNYPQSEHHQRAVDTAKILQRMIAEDRAHPQIEPEALARLKLEERVRELIFRLRDQNGHQLSEPGGCDIFEDWNGITNTPAHQLVRLGYAAVPQLIAALDSDTLTRSVGFHRSFYFSHRVLTVGDCSARTLERITGWSFFVTRSAGGFMSKDGAALTARQAAELWWLELQKKGEKQMLIEGVAGASDDAPAQAELLVQRYPDVAAETMMRGVQNSTNSWTRKRLVELIGGLGQTSAAPFLHRELLEGPDLESRVAAAYGLLPHDRAAAIAAMIAEWTKFSGPSSEDDDAWEQLVEFLASRDSAESISTLAHDLRRWPVQVRAKVVESLGDTNEWSFADVGETPSSATIQAIEDALAAALEDTDQRFGMSASWSEKNFSDPRIGDLAAHFLSERWPGRYAFDISGTWKNRERQRIQCLNVWRHAHGMTNLPLHLASSVRLSRRHAGNITLIEWTPNTAKPQNTFASRVSALLDKPLKADDLVRLFANFAAHPEPGAAGLELNASRDSDLTGVRLQLKLIPGNPPLPVQDWNMNQRVVLGRQDLHNRAGGGSEDPEDWQDFATAVKKAIAGPPEMPFEITVRLAASGAR